MITFTDKKLDNDKAAQAWLKEANDKIEEIPQPILDKYYLNLMLYGTAVMKKNAKGFEVIEPGTKEFFEALDKVGEVVSEQ